MTEISVHSIFNACMYRDKCRMQDHELDRITAERDHAIEQAAKNADEVLRLREALQLAIHACASPSLWLCHAASALEATP